MKEVLSFEQDLEATIFQSFNNGPFETQFEDISGLVSIRLGLFKYKHLI